MSQLTPPRLCAVCSDPVDPEEAHWLHERDCENVEQLPARFCTCDLLVHPGCCPGCIDDARQLDGWVVIHTYTRAQAIADGVLVDITSMAQEAGWRWPVAITRNAWDRCVSWPTTDGLQDENGRLWDVVWMARGAVRRARDGAAGRRLPFTVHVVPLDHGGNLAPRPETLYVDAGSGDNGEPVITIMLPGDD
jgi:uncharacterized protein DUF6573